MTVKPKRMHVRIDPATWRRTREIVETVLGYPDVTHNKTVNTALEMFCQFADGEFLGEIIEERAKVLARKFMNRHIQHYVAEALRDGAKLAGKQAHVGQDPDTGGPCVFIEDDEAERMFLVPVQDRFVCAPGESEAIRQEYALKSMPDGLKEN